MDRPAITVVTVALNAGTDLPLTIESVLAQSYKNIEYLVVDGLSHDLTYDYLARYAGQIDRVMSVEDSGVYQAMNFAAREAQGEFILFLNAGDRLYCADAIEAMVARRASDSDVFYGDHIYVDGRLESQTRAADFGLLRRRLLHGRIDKGWHLSIPAHQATFTRTSILRELAYDVRYSICADHEFLLRAYDSGARLQYIDEIVAHYFAGGMSGTAGAMIHREWAHAYRKHSLRPADVDKFFFQSAAASPFPSRTSYSGLLLDGAFDEETISGSGERWSWANTVTLGPPAVPAVGLELRGASLCDGQVLGVSVDGAAVGSKVLRQGPFCLRYAFAEPLGPGQSIQITPRTVSQLSNSDYREAGWGFEALNFLPCAALTSTGFCVGSSSISLLEEILVEGWCGPEIDLGQVWSEAEQASIAFSTSEAISRLAITCAGNPHVTYGQKLTVMVNGMAAGAFGIDPGVGFAECHLNVEGHWRQGANIIKFCVDSLVDLPGDSGRAGIGLRRITWS